MAGAPERMVLLPVPLADHKADQRSWRSGSVLDLPGVHEKARGAVEVKLKLTEADVALACRDHAEAHGWLVLRITADKHAGQHQKRHEKVAAGTPDYVALREARRADWPDVQAFFLETKCPGGLLRMSQVGWKAQAERDGFLVCVADSFEAYLRWYEEHFG